MAGIDYGAIVFKNGERYKGDRLYPSIDELGFTFYKRWIEKNDDSNIYCVFTGPRYAWEVDFNNVHIKVKRIANEVYTAKINHNNDNYLVIFGYGIDNDIHIWNKCKIRYLGKRGARKVDNWLRKRGFNV